MRALWRGGASTSSCRRPARGGRRRSGPARSGAACVIWRVCPGVRPCHERISNHCVPRAAAGGSSVTATSTAPGPGAMRDDGGARAVAARARQRDDERDEDRRGGRQPRPARGAIAGEVRARAARAARALADPRAEHAPPTPAASASGSAGGEHRRGPRMRHPDVAPAPLGREADRPDARAGEQREASGRRAASAASLDDRRLGDVEREVRRRVAHRDADEQRQRAADHEEHRERLERAPRAEQRARADERARRGEARSARAGRAVGTAARRSRTRPGRSTGR